MATALIIGSNRGIGLELARQLHARGDAVIAACRKPSPELEALGVRVEAGVDVTDLGSVEALDERLGELELDVLIHNAGVLRRESLDDLDFDAIRWQFDVNALGPLRVVSALRGRLARGSKLALVSSRMGSIADNGSGGSYGYRMSKAALNMAGKSLAVELEPAGVAVILLHPGWVRTELSGNMGPLEPSESARGLIARVDELALEGSGGFRHQSGERLPW